MSDEPYRLRVEMDLDICVCGDYRRDHERGLGKCISCSPLRFGDGDCLGFRRSMQASVVWTPWEAR